MEIIAEYGLLFMGMACVFGFFMAWGVGANDVANAMGTSVGSKALTVKQAILIAMIFEFAGAYLAGGSVTSTIRKGIIDPSTPELLANPDLLVYGMLAALLAAGTWLLVATMFGWPVSTTHSIVGAIVGFAAVGISVEVVNWGKVGTIAASWVVSPLLSGTIAFGIFMSVQRLILNTDNPFQNAKKYVPIYMFLVGFMIAMVTLVKGLKHIGLDLSYGQSAIIALLVGAVIMLLGKSLLSKVKEDPKADEKFHFSSVEKVFGVLMVFTACAMAFAHGSNDVANAVGPLAAVVGVVKSGGEIVSKTSMPWWILLLGGLGIVVGLATYGYRVMQTIGKHITELTPSRGFAAELAAATTVVLASGTGLPISTTHTLVGAVLGVGFARGIGALNLRVIGNIFISWIVTLPAGAGLAILFFYIFESLFT
ncbi:inorganic phosphate transporter [Endozoicomonas sp. SM1973]|uniref:Phosphate transporter n=1 Tax=Spartinivicinus marinus TaxID=2994442 RepID=A0A853I9T1_9GAMM|nr:inorganic phosphate transporter [Spartinivicinus marinus]MCX4026138.1 inorganic phosphate transporter [Spartinivicinus marinus]NYZ66621.1 inorganic phosphate transporter [Spartinivicinus marinus]